MLQSAFNNSCNRKEKQYALYHSVIIYELNETLPVSQDDINGFAVEMNEEESEIGARTT